MYPEGGPPGRRRRGGPGDAPVQVLLQMLLTTDNIERAGYSEKIQPQINANARKWIKNRR